MARFAYADFELPFMEKPSTEKRREETIVAMNVNRIVDVLIEKRRLPGDRQDWDYFYDASGKRIWRNRKTSQEICFQAEARVEQEKDLMAGVLNDLNATPSPAEQLSTMKSRLPADAVYLGSVRKVVRNFAAAWRIEEHFYLVPLHEGAYEWALICIWWDDNWSKYEWSGLVRAAGIPSAGKAAQGLVNKLLSRKWRKDLSQPENKEYAELLESLSP